MLGKKRLSFTTLDRKSKNVKYHVANLNYEKKHYDICCINTNTYELPNHDFQVKLITTIPDAIKTAVSKATKPWLWIISDLIDYSNFDFDWLPEEGDEKFIHCWPSGTSKKGDTFLINVIHYLNNDNIEYNFEHEPLTRKPWPITWYDNDTLCLLLENPQEIYNLWIPVGSQIPTNYPDICIWEKRPIVSLNKSNSISLIPRDYIFNGNEIYQYPYLLRYPDIATDVSSDIIMISNGESCAEKNWERLCELSFNPNHISGINGRLHAYKVAAQESNSPV